MQKFFRDKTKLFECNISVDGAKLNETKARLILEFPNKRNLLFYGNIDDNGKCSVTIPALKEMDEAEGNVILEIIAESTHFESWRDKFKLETNKKVQVEMVEPRKEIVETKITPRVEIINEEVEEPVEKNEKLEKLNKYLAENKIDINTVLKSKSAFLNLLVEYKRDNNLTKEDIFGVVNEIKKTQKNNKLLNS